VATILRAPDRLTTAPRTATTTLFLACPFDDERGRPRSWRDEVIGGGGGWDGLVQLFAQNQRLFPAGDDLSEVVRLARIQRERATKPTTTA
jgi:hypothetical protein